MLFEDLAGEAAFAGAAPDRPAREFSKAERGDFQRWHGAPDGMRAGASFSDGVA
jgi:hypothetical protein